MKSKLILSFFAFISLFAICVLTFSSCSNEDDGIKNNPSLNTGYYNFNSPYNNDLLLKIANSGGSVSFYGSTNGSNIDIIASLYKENSTGRRTIYKVNTTADTSIVYDFDKPEVGGLLFIKKNTNVVVQEFEFQPDKKSIKPTLYLATISTSSNRVSQSKVQRSKDDSDFLKEIEEAINDTAAWFMTNGASEYIKALDDARKKLLDDYDKMKNRIEEFLKNKSEKNPEPIQKEINEDPDPTLEPVNPISENPFIDCKGVENGYAFLDNCNICVGVGTGEKSCDCTNSTLALTISTTTNSATVNPIGGQGNYYYLWSNGSKEKTVTNLTAGTYTVTLTDDFGCSISSTINVGLGFDLTGSWKINQSKSNCLDGDTFIVSFNSDSTFNLQNITSSSIYQPISYNLNGNNLIVVFSYQTIDMCDLTDSLYDANATVTISTTYEASTDSFMGTFDVYWKITPSCSGESNILICQDNISIIRN